MDQTLRQNGDSESKGNDIFGIVTEVLWYPRQKRISGSKTNIYKRLSEKYLKTN